MDLVVRQARPALPGETIFGHRFDTGPGGKGLNQAVAAARAGARVAFLGAVGDDDFGARLRATLVGEGIDVDGLVTLADPTGIAAITVTDDGENSIVVVPGANASSALRDADRGRIAAASHLVVQLERPLELVLEACRFARSQGVRTVVTPAPVADGLDELIDLADVLVLNEGEAQRLAGRADAEDAATALSERAGLVIVTLGARGALVAERGTVRQHIAARPVAAVDTTGAGDAFVGALVAWLAGGAELTEAGAAASAAASLAVTRAGAAASAPTREEILAILSGSDE